MRKKKREKNEKDELMWRKKDLQFHFPTSKKLVQHRSPFGCEKLQVLFSPHQFTSFFFVSFFFFFSSSLYLLELLLMSLKNIRTRNLYSITKTGGILFFGLKGKPYDTSNCFITTFSLKIPHFWQKQNTGKKYALTARFTNTFNVLEFPCLFFFLV